MLNGLHILLTYTCLYECDHCFLYCGPGSQGTFPLDRLRTLLGEARAVGSVDWIYFEGGEPFLHYPLLLEGVREAKRLGFRVGIVTNAYWCENGPDAGLWMKPLADLRVDDFSISTDAFHGNDEPGSPARMAAAAAAGLGLPADVIRIEGPQASPAGTDGGRGAPVVGGAVRFCGRAVETLTEGLPRKPLDQFRECPYEDLRTPQRVHVDPFGNVHVCQGISAGNVFEVPLPTLLSEYDADAHPICGPLSRGGPLLLAREHGVTCPDAVDACHACFLLRLSLLDRFPDALAPRQVYGVEEQG